MILVTGADGINGAELVKQLSSAAGTVRAMVRRREDAGRRPMPGVKYITADFDDPVSIRRALEGVDRAFLVTNSSERVEEQQLDFVRIARAAGLQHIVYLSQLHAAVDSPVRFLRYHAAVENAIAASGICFTHLRPNLYMQSLLGFRPSISSTGKFFAPMSDAAVSLVDVRDIAAVAVKALLDAAHHGKIYDITGPQALTHAEVAAQLTQALAKKISFVDIPKAAMRDAALELGLPVWHVDGLLEDYAHYRRGEAASVSSAIRDVTGLPARAFADFARDYARAFSA
jgi:uncharacterized protein YbjT (DUF2867 family)